VEVPRSVEHPVAELPKPAVVPSLNKPLDVPLNGRGAPVSPRTVAKTKFTGVEMREMNSGNMRCARCESKFSLFQAPDRCGKCEKAVCTKCSVNVANAPHLLKTTFDPTICVSCWPQLRSDLVAGPPETREELQREVVLGDAYFALPMEQRMGALEVEAQGKKNANETTAAYFERNPCVVCSRGYDLFRTPTGCATCSRHVCSSAACSKRVENLPGAPMTCRECWPANRKRLEEELAAPALSEDREASIILEMCLANKFLEELRPAQQRVNIQQETHNAHQQAQALVTDRRIARKGLSPSKPEPPSSKPPVAPLESDSSEELTPRMQTRAVVPDTTAHIKAPVVVATKEVVASSVVTTADPKGAALEGVKDTVQAERALATGEHAPAVDAVAVSAVAVAPIVVPVVAAHKEVEETHVAQTQVPAPVKEPVRELPRPAVTVAQVAKDKDSDSLSSEEDEAKRATNITTTPSGDLSTAGCGVCIKPFNMFRREKQCSECQKSVCNQCVGFFRLRSLQDSKPRYICFSCLPAVREKVIDPSFKGAELVRATREAAAVDLLLSGNLHQHYVSTDFSPAELADMKSGELHCARSGDKFDFSRPPRRCTDCNSACTSRDCRNFDWVARILQRPQPSTLCRACWPAARVELLQKLNVDKDTEARVMDEVAVGDAYFALNRKTDFPEPPRVERGQRCHTCTKKFTLFRIPQKCAHCSELVCTGVACSGRFLVPALSRTQPSVVCSGCLHKVTISRPPPGQLTSQQDNPLIGGLANAVTSGTTCKECNKGFSFWERPHMCPETGNMVHVSCCKVVGGQLVSKSFGVEAAATKGVVTLSDVLDNKDDEEVESVSETDTSTSVDDSPTSAAAPADDVRSAGATATSGAAVAASAAIAAAEKSEDITSTSTTTDDEAEAANTNAAKVDAVAAAPSTTAGVVAAAAAPNAVPKDFNLTSWYPYLKQFTAPTSFVEATHAEIQALVLASDPKVAAKANMADLRVLEGKLDRAIEEQGGVVFIKIETRSPKDVLQSASMMDRLRGLVKPTMKPVVGEPTVAEKIAIANTDTIAFVKGIRQLFKVKTGAEAIAMLKMSERVRQDLEKAEGSSLICVRRWRDVDAAREFRAFVFNRKLTGCSQYCYFQCFPELLTDVDALSKRVENFFNKQVLPVLPYSDAVVDFHVTDGMVEVIELSPFSFSTGACMFSWKSDADKAQLEQGPFELRILKEPKSNPYECLPSKWRSWFEQERGFSLRAVSAAAPAANGAKVAAPAGGAAASRAAPPVNVPALPMNPPPVKKEEKKEEKKKWTFGKKKGEDAKKKK
jgi:hypothetical protein